MANKLSKYQTKIITEMKEGGLYLWHNEGNNLRAWLGDVYGAEHMVIRFKTAEALFNKGALTLSDGDYPQSRFRYVLREAK